MDGHRRGATRKPWLESYHDASQASTSTLLNADEFQRMQNDHKNGLPVIISRPESLRI
jgi:hypothetical protein